MPPHGFVSPIRHLTFDHEEIPLNDKCHLFNNIPTESQLVKPYWRNKMKAFEGNELLSWELQDSYRREGLTLNDVIESLRACPLDADIWNFFNIFDFAEISKAECYRRGVIAGETYLGAKFFAEETGKFWGILETRPYMRSMLLLYRSLIKLERPADALPIGRKLMRLCPNDNLGVRFTLEQVEAAIQSPSLAARLAQSFAKEDAEEG
jgi:hypothetical protein